MASELFKWGKDGSCPDLEPHSSTKLEVVRDYIVEYLQILVRSAMGKEDFKITIVDAFAGGGKYNKGEDGSPFVLLKAVREAEALINTRQQRKKPLVVDAHFYFVEKAANAFKSLRQSLTSSEWSNDLDKTIFLYHNSFHEVADGIMGRTQQRHPRGGSRVIFFLDQCGWAQVNAKLIASLAEGLNHKAEFILNFACDWLSAYISGDDKFRKAYDGLGIEDLVPHCDLLRLKEQTGCDYRYAVASKLGPALKAATKARFFSPFYVEPTSGSNHGYWLVHLAPHLRARNAMMDVYYRKQTHIRAFGNTGLRMLAFRPDVEPTGHLTGFQLDNQTLARAKKHLAEDLNAEFRQTYATGVTFRKLCEDRIDDTVANISLLGDAVVLLAQNGELNVYGPNGGDKRTNTIEIDDIIQVNRAPFLPFSRETLGLRLAH
jgi:three-Cys-motif partner protein